MNALIALKLKQARLLIGDNQLIASEKSGVYQKDISLMESGKKKYIPIEYLSYLLQHKIDLNSLLNNAKELEINDKKDLASDLKNQNMALEEKVRELTERIRKIKSYVSSEMLLLEI